MSSDTKKFAIGFLGGVAVVACLGASSNIGSLLGLSDVNSANPAVGNVLRGDGSVFQSQSLNHSDLAGIGSSDHHIRPAAGTLMTEDGFNNFNVESDLDFYDWSNADTDLLSEGVSNLYYTDERVDDRANALIQDGTGLSWTYNDAGNTLTGDVSLSPFDTGNLSEGSNLYYTDERNDDRTASLIQNGTSITWTYNDVGNTLTGNVDPDDSVQASELTGVDTDDLSEGVSNLYYTDERNDDRTAALIQNGTALTWTYSDAGNTLTGNVDANDSVEASELSGVDTDDLSEGVSSLYHTSERVDDRVDALLVEGSNITLTYNDVGNSLTVAATDTRTDVSEGGTTVVSDVTDINFTNADFNVTDDTDGTVTVNLPSIIDADTGFRVNGDGTDGNVLKGDGSKFVSAQLSRTDLSGGEAMTVEFIESGGTYTANSGDRVFLVDTSGDGNSNVTINIAAAAESSGKVFLVKRILGGTVTVKDSGGGTLATMNGTGEMHEWIYDTTTADWYIIRTYPGT